MAASFFKNLFGDEDEQEYYENNQPAEKAPKTRFSSKIVSFSDGQRANQGPSQITLFEPRMYADVKQIASQLLSDHAIVVNFTQMDSKSAARMVDFLNGTVFAIDGEMKRIGKEIFLCAPNNFEVSGDLSTSLKADADHLTD
ncbi:MAG: cell division protein SepF [Limosilactobacillus sp.]|uniref:cell division protein SepF n=1 Tax=Limosilactobacillus sp. TaxID=2773925 RepID=UPI00270E4CC0|nr:cell division protein SepF [Limosilactobacillus sp.]